MLSDAYIDKPFMIKLSVNSRTRIFSLECTLVYSIFAVLIHPFRIDVF